MFKEALGYVESTGLFGAIVGLDFRSKTYVIEDDNGKEFTAKFEDVEVLEKVVDLHDNEIFNKDILGDINGQLYLIELHNDGKIQLHKLNDKLEIVVSGRTLDVTADVINRLEETMVLQGNYYELLESTPKAPEFNIKIVKNFNGNHYTYFYACNNKAEEEIDLIKVVFVGHRTLEEDYERTAFSYEEYQEAIEDGTLKEVSQQELMNFATGATYNSNNTTDEEYEEDIEDEDIEDEDFEGEDDICEECNQDIADCDCDLW